MPAPSRSGGAISIASYGGKVDRALRRRAARVICLDGGKRVLLVQWKDPEGGRVLWEPPGGGVESGESDLEAARRELLEETGLAGALTESWAVEVERDFRWNGQRFAGPERFYGLVVDGSPPVRPAGLTRSEAGAFLGFGWFSIGDLESLGDRLEPPHLAAVITSLLEMRPPVSEGDDAKG